MFGPKFSKLAAEHHDEARLELLKHEAEAEYHESAMQAAVIKAAVLRKRIARLKVHLEKEKQGEN